MMDLRVGVRRSALAETIITARLLSHEHPDLRRQWAHRTATDPASIDSGSHGHGSRPQARTVHDLVRSATGDTWRRAQERFAGQLDGRPGCHCFSIGNRVHQLSAPDDLSCRYSPQHLDPDENPSSPALRRHHLGRCRS